jgi:glutamyl-tRNA synthetase
VTMRTRLAPTPSGALHAGNAFSFLLAWLWARSQGGKVVLRIEDVDTTRARPDWIEAVFRDLEWLGLDWDEGPTASSDTESPFRESSRERQEHYARICREWTISGHLYPCRCTRADLRTDAPQVDRIGDELPPGVPYSGRCRERHTQDAASTDAWRLRLPDSPCEFHDLWMGRRNLSKLSDIGDPVLRRGDGCTAYHLAVCADDADQKITHVVRGRDLLGFSHLHLHMHRLLDNSRPPDFLHHALLGDSQGMRMAKRIGSSSLSGMREAGLDSRRLVGRLANLLFPGTIDESTPCSPADLVHLGPPVPFLEDKPFPSTTLETP